MDTTLGRDRLREFIDLILHSLDEEIDGEGIASRGCLSRYHFDRLVSAAIGESPGAFRRRLLLERAAWELRGNRATITRIALDSGYRSIEGFSRAFSRAFGAAPARYRKAPSGYWIDAPNGVHFHPPCGITVPGPNERSRRMDFVDRIVDHDIWFTNRLLDRAGGLPDEALDRPVSLGPTLFDAGTPGPGHGSATLRELLDDMVRNKENWSAALTGRAAPQNGCTSVEGMKKRYQVAGQEFRKLVGEIRNRGDWDGGFVDAVCDPPESFTYGGMLAHVATFSTVRRSLALVAFRQLGVEDLGIGDPIEWERSGR